LAALQDLLTYCDRLLDAPRFQDYCPNGLQVEGAGAVTKLVSGVTASQALIEAAVAEQADLLLVHHGYFWKGEDPRVTGMKQRRIKTLLANDISLLVYHLPLDAHPDLGNNAQLAMRLGVTVESGFGMPGGPELANIGCLPEPLAAADFSARIHQALGREPQWIPGRAESIHRLGWCTGAAQSYLEEAARRGLDAFVSGEISEPTVHIAREYGIHYFAAGHHATERYGVRALGEHLAAHFGLQHVFCDIDNPV